MGIGTLVIDRNQQRDETMLSRVLAAVLIVSRTLVASAEGTDGMDKIGSFTPPEMNAEETDSVVLPRRLRCDACRAIAYQMGEGLVAANRPGSSYTTKKGKKRMKESVYLEAFDKTCRGNKDNPDAGLGGYGIKNVDGRNRLSGPGLPEADKPGVMMGGSKWPGRLGNKCGELVGEFGEDEIYDAFVSGKPLFDYLCEEDCDGDASYPLAGSEEL